MPSQIRSLPLADQTGSLLSVHSLEIPGVRGPYNASLLQEDDRFLLFFRHDVPVWDEIVPFHTKIGYVELDHNFHPLKTKGVSWIDTRSNYSEDARVFKIDTQYFIAYNDLMPNGKKKLQRGMYVANLDLIHNKVNYATLLDRKTNKTEKNWMPFASRDNQLYFIYSIADHEIFFLENPQKNEMKQVNSRETIPPLPKQTWESRWGVLRGGTPPCFIGDGQYLTFFHSAIKDYRGIVWYVMGAYTFEAAPPFRITAMSPHPILFKGIYEAPHQQTANPMVRCIYPAGLTLRNQNGKDLIHVSCGENDSCVKILTFDKEIFLKSLRPL